MELLVPKRIKKRGKKRKKERDSKGTYGLEST